MTDHIYWKDGALYLLDQRLLPFKKTYVRCTMARHVAAAIRDMVVRGAPLIGIVAAYGVVLGVAERIGAGKNVGMADVEGISSRLAATRPTAVNLVWALSRMRESFAGIKAAEDPVDVLLEEAIAIHVEDIENNRMLSLYGAELIDEGDTILTHCNAGSLATGGYGTALGVIRAAHEAGKKIRVVATETRPYLQGARLTAWELHEEGIPVELVPDNHVAFLCDNRVVDKVIVGADRIAMNGDTANKIGTYMIALAAERYGIPFYVAAPVSTFDAQIPNGAYVQIEERSGDEVKRIAGRQITLKDIAARYYSFDVTAARYVTAFITERGIVERPFRKYIKMLFR